MADDATTPRRDQSAAGGSSAVGRVEAGETDAVQAELVEDEDARPPKVPTRVREMLAMVSQFGPAPSPVGEKLTGEHISKMLEIDAVRVANQSVSERDGRIVQVAALVIVCAFVLWLVSMLLNSGNAQLTEKILIGLVNLVAGVIGGFGIGRATKRG